MCGFGLPKIFQFYSPLISAPFQKKWIWRTCLCIREMVSGMLTLADIFPMSVRWRVEWLDVWKNRALGCIVFPAN
jgi:hypothetical protein